MCVGFMMIGFLFILLKKATLKKWWVSRPLTFFSAFQRWLTDLGNKKQISIYTIERLAVSKSCAKTLLFAIQCSSLHSLFQKSVNTLTLSCFQNMSCKHLDESIAWVWGRTICFFWTNGKFIKHSLFENVCLAPRK